MRQNLVRASFLIVALLVAGCVPVPYIGIKIETPARHIAVVDTDGHPLTNYDLFVYRCTDPGSQANHVFYFPAVTQSDFYIRQKGKLAIKKLGGIWLAPDFYESFEPQPYWVAAVNKHGYRSRRWSLDESQGNPVKIVLEKSPDPGEDYCDGTIGECNPCRSFEYHMYQDMRYRWGPPAKQPDK